MTFRPIPGFDRYQVNILGTVRRRSTDKKRRVPEFKVLKGTLHDGFRVHCLNQEGRRCYTTDRQLVLKSFGVECPAYPPRKRNIGLIDPALKSNPGERNGNHRLTEDEVREIRRLYSEGGWTQRALAARFQVAQGTVSFILQNQTWKHVTQDA